MVQSSITNGVPQWSITEPIPLKVFSNNPGDWIECILSKFVDKSNNKLEKAVSVLEGRAVT